MVLLISLHTVLPARSGGAPSRYTVRTQAPEPEAARARAAPDRVPPSQAPGPAPLYKSQNDGINLALALYTVAPHVTYT